MKHLTLLALVAIAAATEYPITGTPVHCRDAPSTDASIVKSYKKGEMVSITCQTEGTKVSGTSVWDKTGDGCYVSDYLIKTGKNGYFTTKCAASGNSTTSAAPSSSAMSSSEDACPPVTTAGGNATMPGGVVPTGSAPIGGGGSAPTGSGGAAPSSPTAGAGEVSGSVVYAAVPVVLGLLQLL